MGSPQVREFTVARWSTHSLLGGSDTLLVITELNSCNNYANSILHSPVDLRLGIDFSGWLWLRVCLEIAD